jgi:CheY-like chemotaxis protein
MTAFSAHDETARDGPSVLVVEDEVMVRVLIAETLREAGCEVTEVANADEAVRALKSTAAPDVMVTDVKLPGGMNGVDLAACLRRTRPQMKVIVTSGHATAENTRHVADAFLAKPFELSKLVGQVRSLTSHA